MRLRRANPERRRQLRDPLFDRGSWVRDEVRTWRGRLRRRRRSTPQFGFDRHLREGTGPHVLLSRDLSCRGQAGFDEQFQLTRRVLFLRSAPRCDRLLVSLRLCVQLLRVLVGKEPLNGHQTLHGPRVLRVATQNLQVRAFRRAVLTRSDKLPRPVVLPRGVVEARCVKRRKPREEVQDRHTAGGGAARLRIL